MVLVILLSRKIELNRRRKKKTLSSLKRSENDKKYGMCIKSMMK